MTLLCKTNECCELKYCFNFFLLLIYRTNGVGVGGGGGDDEELILMKFEFRKIGL